MANGTIRVMKPYFKYLIFAGLAAGAAMLWWSILQPGPTGGTAVVDAGPGTNVESPVVESVNGVPESAMAPGGGTERTLRKMPGRISSAGVEQSRGGIPEDYTGPGMETPLSEPALGFETEAIELTLDNVLDGHPLGFLGLGWSYVNGDYFTPRNLPLGIAYLIAADLCSSGAFPVHETIANYSGWASIPGIDYPAEEEVAELGARLNDIYCATRITPTQGPQP